MKTPEDIKKGLECCTTVSANCSVCPYEGECLLPFGNNPESDALAYIRQIEAAASKWISVEDRLPEDDLPEGSEVKLIKVLVAIKAKNGVTVRTQTRHQRTLYDTRREPFFDWEWRYSAGKVTHWMPLPELPEEPKRDDLRCRDTAILNLSSAGGESR